MVVGWAVDLFVSLELFSRAGGFVFFCFHLEWGMFWECFGGVDPRIFF